MDFRCQCQQSWCVMERAERAAMIGKGEDKAMIVISQTSHIGGAKQQRQGKQASKQASSGDEGLGSPGSLSVVTYVSLFQSIQQSVYDGELCYDWERRRQGNDRTADCCVCTSFVIMFRPTRCMGPVPSLSFYFNPTFGS